MYVRILLGVLCIHVVISADVNTKVNSSVAEFDDFIALLATPVKDEFDWRLLQKFSSSKGYGNVILSPISLKLVLALLYEGAAGLTEKEFQTVLKFPSNKTIIQQNFSDLLDTLVVNRRNYIINIGTQLFLDSRFQALTTYRAKALKYYHAEVSSTNFSNTDEASISINNWVEYLTNGRIKSLVTPDDIENAVLLVTNAIYFKGIWSVPFPRNETFTSLFYTSNRNSVSVPYMKHTEKFFYFDSKSLDSEILRLPYRGRKFAFYIVLPHSTDGLSHLIDNLNLVELTLSVRSMDLRPVEVILPKFRFDFQARYSKVLSEFGFDTLFRGVASFPGIVRDQEAQLIVTDILQKSGIDINEEGSIVYTTTQVTIGNKFGGQSVVTFNASRPFLFFIQEEITKNLLFIGKIENPLETESKPLPPRFGSSDAAPAIVPLTASSNYQPLAPIATTGSQFDLELLKNSLGTSKNVLLSPSSIKIALAMLAEAGSGRTSEEIYSTLRIPYNARNQVLQGLVSELSATHPHSTLEFQNALFVSDRERIKAQYQMNVERYYKALVKQINYQDPANAAGTINTFINNATRGFIPSVLAPDDLDPNTEIILTNVLYFKASWLKTFDSKLTKLSCFHTPKGCVSVPFMHIIDIYNYGETPNAYIMQLNYTGNQRAMLLVVPKRKDGLLAALNDMEAYQSFAELVDSLNETEVELILPRFEIDYGTNIVYTLQKMGIRQVFSTNSNLSNLLENDKSGLVDRFVHKTKIEVNEEGTEASAVSLVSVIPLMGSSNPKIRADHPFAFFVFNTQTKTILFEGTLNEPEHSSGLETKTGNIYMYNRGIPSQQIPDQRHLFHINNMNRF